MGVPRCRADPQSAGGLGPNRVVERPKVIRTAATGKYVMYLHIDASYGEAEVGVATGDTPCGAYAGTTYVYAGDRWISTDLGWSGCRSRSAAAP